MSSSVKTFCNALPRKAKRLDENIIILENELGVFRNTTLIQSTSSNENL